MKAPKVSVIMAAYNSERFIPKAIESIINQTLREWELIIINDRSTDKTPSIIRKYKKKDPRIKLINLKENLGPAAARNFGLKIAKGKYISILDSDDIAHPKRLEKQCSFLENHKEIFLVGSFVRYIDEEDNLLGEEKIKKKKVLQKLKDADQLPTHSTISWRNGHKIFYKKELLRSEDLELMLRILKKGKKIAFLPETLADYRKHTPSTSHSNRKIQQTFQEGIKKKYCNQVIKENVENRSDKDKIIDYLHNKCKLSAIYESNDNKEYRKLLIKFIKENGILRWRKEIFYYGASFFPKSFKNKIKRLLIF